MTSLSECEARFRRVGTWLGYPPCCIDDFLYRYFVQNDHAVKQRPLRGTGYVPCPLCVATYTDEEMIERIQARRVCPKPFPTCPPREVNEFAALERSPA